MVDLPAASPDGSVRRNPAHRTLRRRFVRVPDQAPSTDAIFLVLRRMRAPLIILVVGGVFYGKLGVDQFPKVDFPAVVVTTSGASGPGASGATEVTLTGAINDPDRAAAKRAFDAMMGMRKIDVAAIEAAWRG